MGWRMWLGGSVAVLTPFDGVPTQVLGLLSSHGEQTGSRWGEGFLQLFMEMETEMNVNETSLGMAGTRTVYVRLHHLH